MSFVKNAAAGALLGGALLVPAGFGIANAEPVPAPDGLVSIAVGDTTILQNVPAEVAAHTAGALCGTAPEEVGELAQQVDSDGTDQTVCAGLPGGDLILTQNVSTSQEHQGHPGQQGQDDHSGQDDQSGDAGQGAEDGSGAAATSPGAHG